MKGYTLAELKKKYAEMSKEKGYRGWHEATKENAGNVPLNNAIFNMMTGSSKSVNMAQVNADNFVGDTPVAAPDGGIGMVGMAEDINNEPLTLKVTFDDGDYLVTQYTGTLNKAKDKFIGRTMRWEDERDEKTGVNVKLVPMSNLVSKGRSARMQEDMDNHDFNRVRNVVGKLGSVNGLTADDWAALKDSPELNSIREDLWMYGNEVRALMAYVFEDEARYDTVDMIYNKYAPRIGVGVDRTLKELQKREMEEREKKWKQEKNQNHSDEDFNESFNGDEHALIERISALKDGEILRLKNFHNDASLEEPLDMCIKKNFKFPGRYILWNEGKNSGEKLNVVNFSSLDNAVEWAKQADEFLTESKRK